MLTEEELQIGGSDYRLEVARLLRELREKKGISQGQLAKRIGRNRQVVAQLEQGIVKNINLRRLDELVAACGEGLIVTTTEKARIFPLDTHQEDQVLVAFAKGQIGKAERLLADLRRWQYPATQVMACCKRNMAVTMSYYFKGRSDLSHAEMNKIVMGLGLIGFAKEAYELKELYEYVLDQAEGIDKGGETT